MEINIKECLTKTFDLYPEDKNELKQLTELGRILKISSGDIFFDEGEKADQFYVILQGNVGIYISAGSQAINLYTARPEEIFGWSSLVEPRLYKGTAKSISDVTVLEFYSPDLLAEMKKNSRLGYLIMYRTSQFISQRLLETTFDLLADSVSSRATGSR
jgi:CRP-like cAMP-binding protein